MFEPYFLEDAVRRESEHDCLKLLKSGYKTKYKERPLYYAVKLRNVRIIEMLLKHGEPVTVEMLYLQNRPIKNEEKLLKLLLSYSHENLNRNCKPLINLGNIFFSKPEKFCKILVKHGFDVNGHLVAVTPLTAALMLRNQRVIITLLFYGADPCRQYRNAETVSGFDRPLNYVFTQPISTIECIIKYAALYVDYADLHLFYHHFKLARGRPYLKFSQSCINEIRTIKRLLIDSKRLNLFDFLISQGSWLKLYLENGEITDRVFEILSATSLPIYKNLILKKLRKKDLRKNIIHLSYLKFKAVLQDKEVYLNSHCIYHMCKFLLKDDLISLWKAFAIM